MDKNKKLYIAGHKGMVGSAIQRKFEAEGFDNFVTRTVDELDLRNQFAVTEFFELEKPDYVIVAAAKVGGILANNTYRAEFLYDNLMIESNLIHAAHQNNVEKLLFLGSSCIYPKLAPQPLKEESLLSGYLEYTNEPYAIAKIAGIKLCESYYKQYGSNFYSVMPTNLYGPFDNYDLNSSHVLPALIRKFHEATKQSMVNRQQSVVVWGTGTPKREFLYVEDLADAIYFLMNKIDAKDIYDKGITHINIGSGEDVTIKEVAELIKKIVGYDGEIVFDTTKPDGTPRKLMDVSLLNELGWKYSTSLEEGIRKAYEWFVENRVNGEL
ncbi:MAG: GDP-fucose synthetase [Stygiobacter sp. RIFOXYC12_FULL_38_8]|nr:MAG: GDP-fucose synthetase [Stygiobacter sp. RIFOXYB2_FULL_37_11]OGV11540.1 MAG: GDP-fucose synthetase [Stygiobacter sp. RIFOXYA2_FULL_38_8]OGV15132.1 MAG: GDP-fucose synthetase [Stygiobacter sp. RIFOXYC2_FULL_38_25]OGV22126.1 MAG: GDP-fucose synthetase [Stygiobacter sp. RIFOXYC12_FULL_38_8]OGV79707.1 MAG: GDP-fucose synthetase [Stygiobacter sp. GWF2_38_21]